MNRILAYTTPARGHLFPIVPILDELRGRGVQVCVRTLASEVDWLQERGFDASPIDPAIEQIELDDHKGKNPIDKIKRAVRVFTQRAPIDGADLQQAIDTTQPDALLIDVNAWGANAAAEASGTPWATWAPYPLPLPSRDVPPYGPGLPPARGALGRLRDRLLEPIVFGGVERVMLPPTNELRVGHGLPTIDSVGELHHKPDLLLYMTAEPFEYRRTDWPTNLRMVGPMAWEPPAEAPAWLGEIDRPIVLVTTSSEFQDDGKIVATALEALADEDVFVVATVPAGDPATFDVPANARVETFVPHGPILERAACAITHGGMGATQKALAHGVPVCAIPFGRDQLEVARRVQTAGAGTRLPAPRLRADRLREAVRTAMSMRAGARRVAEGYRDAGGAPAAADHIETALRRTQVSG